jgi:diadenosine tetraphosphatase ApaH/serine/threonine PP2A family protein phosphatase
MRIALFSDIHGNREALEACLAHAERSGVDRLVFLGDLVGYGADPQWVVATVMSLVAAGAQAILGNHDAAIRDGVRGMTDNAAAALLWTRAQLSAEAAAFLSTLPLEIEEEDRLFVHADASAPARWHYVTDGEEARRSLEGTQARVTVCGHVHRPCLYGITATSKVTRFIPVAGMPVPLTKPRRWLAVLGAVGQPRDGNPAACYGLLDTERGELTWVRVPYDVATAAAKIRAAGLPERLASRLLQGR